MREGRRYGLAEGGSWKPVTSGNRNKALFPPVSGKVVGVLGENTKRVSQVLGLVPALREIPVLVAGDAPPRETEESIPVIQVGLMCVQGLGHRQCRQTAITQPAFPTPCQKGKLHISVWKGGHAEDCHKCLDTNAQSLGDQQELEVCSQSESYDCDQDHKD